MDIHHAVLDRAKLAAMSEQERVLLLLLSHASNEINVLTKLILMMRKDESASAIEDHVEAGQTFILMRLLIGKLHEGWELFKNRVQADQVIREKYLPKLEAEAAKAVQELNRHFGKGSALTKIRNKISFHYTDDDNLTEKNFQQLSATEPLQFYLGNVGNSFYHAAELVAQVSVINLMTPVSPDPNDTRSAEERMFNELCTVIIDVSRNMTELFGSLVGLLAEDAVDQVTVSNVPDGPKLSMFSLPFFFDPDDALPTSEAT